MNSLVALKRIQIEEKNKFLHEEFNKKTRLIPYWHENLLFEMGYVLYRNLNLDKAEEWRKDRFWKYFKHRWDLQSLMLNPTQIRDFVEAKQKWVGSEEFIEQVCIFLNKKFKHI